MKSDMKYVLVKKYEDGSEAIFIIDDPIELFKNGEYSESRGDKLYQLGLEVTVETNIKITSATTFWSKSTLTSSFPYGLKGGLDVGEYRG